MKKYGHEIFSIFIFIISMGAMSLMDYISAKEQSKIEEGQNVNDSNPNLWTKQVEFDYIDKNSKCSIVNCPSTKVLYFKGNKKAFLIPDDSQAGLIKLMKQISHGNIVMSLYRYRGLDCVYSVKVINEGKEEPKSGN